MDYIKLAITELEKRSGISAGMAHEQYKSMQSRITALEEAGRKLILALDMQSRVKGYDNEKSKLAALLEK
jgi:hypothetical protein